MSLVGLVILFCMAALAGYFWKENQRLRRRIERFMRHRPMLVADPEDIDSMWCVGGVNDGRDVETDASELSDY